MKKGKLFAVMVSLALSAMLILGGCGKSKNIDGSKDKDVLLSGTYLLDATALGMPLQVYLIIKDGDTFQWTNKRENGDDKGHGTVGKNDGTYLLLYSDSTADSPKTATFTVKGGNLHFSTRVPYGTSGFSPNSEDENNIIFPEAKKLIYEEYLGEYVGKSGEYEYSLNLSYGAQYTVTSSGQSETYTETGVFAVKDGKLSLTPKKGTAKEASITQGKKISLLGAILNQSGEKADITLNKAITGAYAGKYTSEGGILLILDKLGGYTYKSGGYSELGTFTADSDTFTFSNSNGENRTGTVSAYIAKVSFPKSSGGVVTEITAYESVIQGKLTAAEEVKDGGETPAGKYEATLLLENNGTYSLTISKDGAQVRTENGKFSTSIGAVGTNLDLISTNNDNSSGIIAKNTINFRLVVDEDLNEAGFQFTKK